MSNRAGNRHRRKEEAKDKCHHHDQVIFSLGATHSVRARQRVPTQTVLRRKESSFRGLTQKSLKAENNPWLTGASEGSFPCKTHNLPTAEQSFLLALYCWKQVLMDHWFGSSARIPPFPRAEGSGIHCTYQQTPPTARFPRHEENKRENMYHH